MGLPYPAVEPLEYGDGEGRRLAGAGLGAADQVSPLQHGGDGLGLDGRRHGVPQFVHRAEQLGQQVEFLKSHNVPFSIKIRSECTAPDGAAPFIIYAFLWKCNPLTAFPLRIEKKMEGTAAGSCPYSLVKVRSVRSS